MIITGETAARTSVETIPDPETVVIIHPVPADGGRTSNDSGSAVRQSESHNSQEPGPSGLHRETATGVSANPAHVSEGRNTTDALHGNTARSVPLGRSLPGLDSSISQFRSPKRRKIESPEKKGDTSLEIDEEAEVGAKPECLGETFLFSNQSDLFENSKLKQATIFSGEGSFLLAVLLDLL